jgi:hypothetical protein
VNRFERVTVDFGPFSVYAVPLPFLFFAAFLLGMGAMFLLALPQDRRTRELLRSQGLLDRPPTGPAHSDATPHSGAPSPAPQPWTAEPAAGEATGLTDGD